MTDRSQTTAEQLALERDARRWRQIDYVIGSVITIRDTRISNNALPAAQLGRLWMRTRTVTDHNPAIKAGEAGALAVGRPAGEPFPKSPARQLQTTDNRRLRDALDRIARCGEAYEATTARLGHDGHHAAPALAVTMGRYARKVLDGR